MYLSLSTEGECSGLLLHFRNYIYIGGIPRGDSLDRVQGRSESNTCNSNRNLQPSRSGYAGLVGCSLAYACMIPKTFSTHLMLEIGTGGIIIITCIVDRESLRERLAQDKGASNIFIVSLLILNKKIQK